eukprot:1157224-Pelagomonas_calceolata.AAC.10
MQAVIELGRKIRERGLKPIKTPLRKLVVVHPDTEFLSDVQGGPWIVVPGMVSDFYEREKLDLKKQLEGELLEYVTSELNVREVECCADPLKYATLRAEPDFQALGKRLGPAMKAVCTEVKAMSSEAVLAMQVRIKTKRDTSSSSRRRRLESSMLPSTCMATVSYKFYPEKEHFWS